MGGGACVAVPLAAPAGCGAAAFNDSRNAIISGGVSTGGREVGPACSNTLSRSGTAVVSASRADWQRGQPATWLLVASWVAGSRLSSRNCSRCWGVGQRLIRRSVRIGGFEFLDFFLEQLLHAPPSHVDLGDLHRNEFGRLGPGQFLQGR